MIIELTTQGRALKTQAKSVPTELFCASECTADELVALKAQLESLRGSLMKNVPD